MESLVEKIKNDGGFQEPDIIKVDGFINHQLDVRLLNEIGLEFKKRFANIKVDKILTIEASGIAIASIASQYFDFVPVVFAKKCAIDTPDNENFLQAKAFSFTKKFESKIRVAKKYIKKGENVLIIDDFLALGNATLSLLDICQQGEACVVGVGVVIEKGFQEGGKILRKMGINLESLVIVEGIKNGEILFAGKKE